MTSFIPVGRSTAALLTLMIVPATLWAQRVPCFERCHSSAMEVYTATGSVEIADGYFDGCLENCNIGVVQV